MPAILFILIEKTAYSICNKLHFLREDVCVTFWVCKEQAQVVFGWFKKKKTKLLIKMCMCKYTLLEYYYT